ncbi:MAG TPA: polyprenyl diphosphate synthase [Dongiaceae bacterium]|nr:polyprenyl diphosphate synthase [Dongiaceae bacterium]
MTDFPSALVEIRKAAREPSLAPRLHVALIMGGGEQGDWLAAIRRTIEAAARNGITHLTLFGFTTGLLHHCVRDGLADLEESGIRLSVVGAREGLPSDLAALIAAAEERTRINPGLHLAIALDCGGRADIVSAARRLAMQVRDGALAPHEIDECRLGASLWTGALPPPDLLIRTGGRQRLDDILLWQIAYAEMVFVDRRWSDFTGEDLDAAILEFRRRDRRFGAIKPDILAGAALLP